MKIFVKNENFRQKSKFSSKIEIFKNQNFRQKWNFSTEILIFGRITNSSFFEILFKTLAVIRVDILRGRKTVTREYSVDFLPPI